MSKTTVFGAYLEVDGKFNYTAMNVDGNLRGFINEPKCLWNGIWFDEKLNSYGEFIKSFSAEEIFNYEKELQEECEDSQKVFGTSHEESLSKVEHSQCLT